ncbi:MAG: ATP-binding cassette domain-containing protein [Ignavibacteria bacterium]|nr:ATP-binding cassette domain-containing protein [Ignavibacteria bacterium]
MSITVKNISKSYNGKRALKNFNVEFGNGKTTVLIGPSGCGKSTLLRLIVGLMKQDSGTITVDDELLSNSNLSSIRERMGYVIQDGGLFPHLTARENLSLMPIYTEWNNDEISKRIDELTRLTSFPNDGLGRYPAELSGGQKQRVSLMRALMLDPEFLLFDEPLGALDPLIRFDLQNDLKEIFRTLNKTVILVTHDLNEAVFFGDKILLMKEGSLIQEGTITDFINNPSEPFVTKFIKSQRSTIEFN